MGTSMVAAISVLLVVLLSTTFVARAQNLTSDFYDESCPSVFSIVQQGVQTAVADERRNAASLIRVHFHDCFVNGCDASVLLDTAPGIESEKDAPANNQSLRGFEIIDSIKAALEEACPNTVSCADILAIASRDSAVEVGLTNNYTVLLGRRDSLTSGGVALANRFLPSPVMNNSELVQNFANVNLSVTDLVALSGAHTVGRVSCRFLTGPALFALNNVSIDPDFQAAVTQSCAPNSSTLQNLDLTTPDDFDNNYFSNLQNSEGILISDQSLYSTSGAESVAIVENFASGQEQFFAQFAASTIKMGNLNSGAEGEIRTNCRLVNSASPAQLIAYE